MFTCIHNKKKKRQKKRVVQYVYRTQISLILLSLNYVICGCLQTRVFVLDWHTYYKAYNWVEGAELEGVSPKPIDVFRIAYKESNSMTVHQIPTVEDSSLGRLFDRKSDVAVFPCPTPA